MRQHPLVGAARSDVQAREAAVAEARWQYFPAPSIEVQQAGGGAVSVAALDQPLWTGGRLKAQVQSQRALLSAAQEGVFESGVQVGLQVVTAYQSRSLAIAQSDVARRGLDRLQERYELIQRRVAAGASADSDRSLVAARVQQAQGELAEALARRRAAEAALRELTGVDFAAATADATLPPPLPSCEAMVEQAERSNPQLRRLAASAAAARAAARSQSASLWPSVGLRLEDRRGDALVRSEDRALVTLRFSPGGGFSTQARIDAARAEAAGADQQYEAGRRAVDAQVLGDCASRDGARERLSRLRSALTETEAVYESYLRLFEAGRRSWLDLINAAREITAIEQAIADAETQVRAAEWRLWLLTEGGRRDDGARP